MGVPQARAVWGEPEGQEHPMVVTFWFDAAEPYGVITGEDHTLCSGSTREPTSRSSGDPGSQSSSDNPPVLRNALISPVG